jgi:hypothetical protein
MSDFLLPKVTLVLVGVGMMIWGLAMGVSIVLLPVGIIVGFAGLCSVLAGFTLKLT